MTHFRIKPKEITKYEFVSKRNTILKRVKPDENFTTEEFRTWIKDNYKIYKEDMSKIQYPEDDPQQGSYGFYLLSYDWMDQWRKFIAGGPRPKQIDNKPLMAEIERLREDHNYPEDDGELGLKDKNNYYILS
jgi:hypothetical protein